MEPTRILYVLFVLSLGTQLVNGENVQGNPLGKVLQLIKSLANQVEEDGNKQDEAYRKYQDWCGNSAQDLKFAIETASSEKEKLEAKIGELDSAITVATSKIGDLASAISTNEEELKKATSLRKREASEFKESEKEMMEAVDALSRAMNILKKAMKSGASFAQLDTSSTEEMIAALGVVLNAASFTGADRDQLSAFLQSQDQDGDEDEELGAPAAAKYKSQSGNILKTIGDMKEKAETQLGESRKAETEARNNYELLKQSLTDQLAADKGDMAEEKGNKASAGEGKASAEGELGSTVKELKEAKKELEILQSTCLTAGADHETSTAARAEELKVIKEAMKILESVSGDDEEKEKADSFVQLASSSSSAAAAREQGQRIVAVVKALAKKHRSASLLHLASKIKAMIRYGNDPFGKIKNLIQDMVAKLEKEAGEEAQEKAYCDEELKKTGSKKVDLEDKVSSMTTKIDQAVSRMSDLKESVKEIQNELAVLTKEEAEMVQIRAEERETYEKAKADLEKSISAVGKALKVLRDYYASKKEESLLQQDSDSEDADMGSFMQQPAPPQKFEKKGGAGTSIIGILEVSESDFAKTLAKVEAEEADSIREFEKMVQENKIAMKTKEADVKYKTQESKSLAKDLAEVSTDRDDTNEELSAVLEFWKKLQDRCIAKPETYEERMKRRKAEIEGLKEALATLEDDTALLQQKQRHRRGNFRGALEAAE